MDKIHLTPVYLADLERAEDTLYSLRQITKNPNSLKRIDAGIIRVSEKIQEFYSSLPTA